MNIKEKLGQLNVGYSLLLPGLFMVFFLISFILNQLSHYFFDPKNVANTVRVQLPVDHAVVSIPKKITQSQPFEVSLQFATDRLAHRINHIISRRINADFYCTNHQCHHSYQQCQSRHQFQRRYVLGF